MLPGAATLAGMVRIVPYGGVGEIGGNKLLVEDGGTRVFLDFGMNFGDHGAYFSEFLQPRTQTALRDLMALDILPAIDGIYRHDACVHPGWEDHVPKGDRVEELWEAPVRSYQQLLDAEGEPWLDAVVVSHAHADHYGHVGYLDRRVEIHCTETTAAMMEAIEEVSRSRGFEGEIVHGRTKEPGTRSDGATFPGAPYLDTDDEWMRPVETHASGETFRVGDLEITLIGVDHSVPGSASVLVEAGDGTRIYYTGDIRFHGTYDAVTEALHEAVTDLRPDAMLCEGTRITREEPDSEASVLEDLTATFEATDGLAMTDFGWKDTTRFATVMEAARSAGRELVIDHKLAYVLEALSGIRDDHRSPRDLDDVSVYLPRSRSMLYSPDDYNRDKTKAGYLDDWSGDPTEQPGALAHLREGTRAADVRRDPEAYVVKLSQWAMTELVDLAPPPGSSFVRCACEPFSDEMAIDLERQGNWLKRFGIPVRETATPEGGRTVEIPEATHASGHASGPDLTAFVERVDPETIVPIHTEDEAAFHDRFSDVVSPTVGEPIEVTPG